MSGENISEALAMIGRNEEARARFIASCQFIERLPEHRLTTVRDEITGPIVDALHRDVSLIRKELSSGIILEFPYRSKIARDFVMAVPEKPDHVWEPQTTRLLLHLSKTTTDVVVGGAYFGDHAILIADALRNRGRCHAFEPDPNQSAALARNASFNGLTNLIVHTAGLWSDTTTKLAFVGHDALASTVASEDGMHATTIDSYASAANIDRLGLIMLDLEGTELQALRGAERVLRDDAPHVVFEIHRSYVDWSIGLANTEVVHYLVSFGYVLFAIRDFQSNYDMRGRPIELVPIETAYLEGPPHGFNVFATRDTSVITSEHFVITPNVSPKLLFHRDPKLHHPAGGL